MIKLYFSTVKVLAQRPTHISAVATVLLITKTFTVRYYERQTDRQRQTETKRNTGRHREPKIERHRQTGRQQARKTARERRQKKVIESQAIFDFEARPHHPRLTAGAINSQSCLSSSMTV